MSNHTKGKQISFFYKELSKEVFPLKLYVDQQEKLLTTSRFPLILIPDSFTYYPDSTQK